MTSMPCPPDPNAQLARERQHLAQTEAFIAAGEQHMADLGSLLDDLEHTGGDLTEAQALLDAMRETVAEWHLLRARVIALIDRLTHLAC